MEKTEVRGGVAAGEGQGRGDIRMDVEDELCGFSSLRRNWRPGVKPALAAPAPREAEQQYIRAWRKPRAAQAALR